MPDIHIGKKLTKNYIFTGRCKHFTTGREIDKEVVDELFHAEEVGNKYFQGFLQDKLGEGKKSFFEPFYLSKVKNWKQKGKEAFKNFTSRKGGLSGSWFVC